jgi:hypothetical protein
MVEATPIRFKVDPRDVPPAKAARRLHLTEAEFFDKLDQLHGRGFPNADPVTGHFDLRAIDTWMDLRHGELFKASQPTFSASAHQASLHKTA